MIFPSLGAWLVAVTKSWLLGKFKANIYQHGILASIVSPLLVYSIPQITVAGFRRKVRSLL